MRRFGRWFAVVVIAGVPVFHYLGIYTFLEQKSGDVTEVPDHSEQGRLPSIIDPCPECH